jgi:hypothetical protein
MYLINTTTNRINALPTKYFSELGFTERKHLQEWLAYEPSALGEEFLIIQKEFDGFDETRERLDLLALDKAGNLVIIENKLDDSGRDVVWQALKYASYCSSLSKLQIIEIYQQYLNRYQNNDDAVSQICEFLEIPDIEEIKLNTGNSQRLILVAAYFRKEVTSTVLWLLGQGLSIQCFKVTPYQLQTQLLLSIEQIIPTPEEQEFRIGMSVKEAEEKTADVMLKNRHNVRTAFWEKALEKLRHSECNLYNNISASKDHWLSAGSGISGCTYTLIFGQKEIRVELSFHRAKKEENKYLFDYFYTKKEEIETQIGKALEWLRLDSKKASRMQINYEIDSYNNENWEECINWLIDNLQCLEKAMSQYLPLAARHLKQISMQSTDMQ